MSSPKAMTLACPSPVHRQRHPAQLQQGPRRRGRPLSMHCAQRSTVENRNDKWSSLHTACNADSGLGLLMQSKKLSLLFRPRSLPRLLPYPHSFEQVDERTAPLRVIIETWRRLEYNTASLILDNISSAHGKFYWPTNHRHRHSPTLAHLPRRACMPSKIPTVFICWRRAARCRCSSGHETGRLPGTASSSLSLQIATKIKHLGKLLSLHQSSTSPLTARCRCCSRRQGSAPHVPAQGHRAPPRSPQRSHG